MVRTHSHESIECVALDCESSPLNRRADEAFKTTTVDEDNKPRHSEPNHLPRWYASKVFGVVLDIIMIMMSGLCLVYAFAVKRYEGTEVDSSYAVHVLERVSQLVSQ